MRSAREWRLRWYVAAGAITFLTQYPRLDNFHLLWTACVPLVVAERRNPTRYAHLYPGAASPDELERLIATLEAAAVRTVVVSDGWLFVWTPPGPNARLEDYLASTYRDAARFGTYRVLTRKETTPGGAGP